MTIVIASDTYLPQINGVVTSVSLVRAELEHQGHRVILLCPTYGGRETHQRDVHRYASVPYPNRMMREQRYVLPWSREPFGWKSTHVDVIHSQVPGSMGTYALGWARRNRIPHVHTYHTDYMQYVHYTQFAPALFRKGVRWRARTFCNRCQRVVVPSRAIGNELRSYGVTVPLDLIPTGVDLQPPRPHRSAESLRRALAIPDDRRILTFVGRMAQEKNIAFILKAMARLQSTGRQVHLVMVGDGPGREGLEVRVRELELQENVTFTGYVPRSQVWDYYGLADVVVFSSLTETQGIVLLEAMSAGTPVVALSAMGVAELMADGKGGLASNPGDLTRFVSHIGRLLDDPDLHTQKAAEALAKARDWSIQTTVTRLLECYRSAIESGIR